MFHVTNYMDYRSICLSNSCGFSACTLMHGCIHDMAKGAIKSL